MGGLLPNKLFIVLTVGEETLVVSGWKDYRLCVNCAAFAGNEKLWLSFGYPTPHLPHPPPLALPGAYAIACDDQFGAGDFCSEGCFPPGSRSPIHPSVQGVVGACRLASWCSSTQDLMSRERQHTSSGAVAVRARAVAQHQCC